MTSGYLLDVNVLVALAWPNHSSHRPAADWFMSRRDGPFATCPVTETGFIRVSMNPLVVGEPVSLSAVLHLLERYRSYNHVFWTADLDAASAFAACPGVAGHRQVTDAYLLALAATHDGTLVSFDSGIRSLARGELASRLEIIPPE